MALIKCPECGKEISDKAKSCPHCGFPIEQKDNPTTKEESGNPLVVIAARGSRGYQSFTISISVLLFIICAAGFVLSIIWITVPFFGIFLLIVSILGLGVSIFNTVYLSILLKQNSKVIESLIYYDKSNSKFVFYDVKGNKIAKNKNEQFTLRNDIHGILGFGELLLKIPGEKQVILGFTTTAIDVINHQIDHYRNN